MRQKRSSVARSVFRRAFRAFAEKLVNSKNVVYLDECDFYYSVKITTHLSRSLSSLFKKKRKFPDRPTAEPDRSTLHCRPASSRPGFFGSLHRPCSAESFHRCFAADRALNRRRNPIDCPPPLTSRPASFGRRSHGF